nr:M56 family metallopeptidase [Clostridia bacterium]
MKKPVEVRIGTKSLAFGCFKRFIVLDCKMLESHEMILAHELTHCKYHDNITNILIAALRRIYWFSPIAVKALDMINSDMELLCDERALERFRIRKDEYAMLLYRSVKMNDEKETKLISAASMSTAGKQLIRRLSFLNRTKKTKITTFAVSLLLLVAISTSCLTNPIIEGQENNAEIYMSSFASLAASGGTALPEAGDKVTARGFIDMMLLALDAAELPSASRTTLEVFKEGGAECFYDMLCAEYDEHRPAVTVKFISKIDLDSSLTVQQAAFLMNHMLIYLNRGEIFVEGTDGETDNKLYIPAFIEYSELEKLSAALLAKGDSKAELTVKKLNAFYRVDSYEHLLPTENDDGEPLTEAELEAAKLELQKLHPYI